MTENVEDIFKQISTYCEEAGIAESTLLQRSIGNRHFAKRAKGKISDVKEKSAVIRAYIEANPPKPEQNESAA